METRYMPQSNFGLTTRLPGAEFEESKQTNEDN